MSDSTSDDKASLEARKLCRLQHSSTWFSVVVDGDCSIVGLKAARVCSRSATGIGNI